jgi:multidrug efflux system membrane fusion protein
MMPVVRPLVLTVLVLATACSREPGERGAAPPPVPVAVASAASRDVPIQLRAIGHVEPSQSVTVRAREGGVLARVHFKEGQDVTDGQLLFTLERGPLEAELRQTEATLARDRAQLENAQKDASRYTELAKRGYVAQQQADQAQAVAAALEATVRADRAVVDSARLRLGYMTIRAPLAGRTGTLLVHEGDVIKANDTPLVLVNQLRPIDVTFTLPERELDAVRRASSAGILPVVATGARDATPLAEGRLGFIDNRVDPATGTIQLKATFANDAGQLWPGAYVNVVMTLGTDPAAVVVPTVAVQRGQEGTYVFVVKPDRTVESRPVNVRREVGTESVIAQGLAPGETVVTEGQLRLAPGARVELRQAAAANTPAPGPGGAAPAPAAPGPTGPTPAPAPTAPAGNAPKTP